jgi:hypothetical protein
VLLALWSPKGGSGTSVTAAAISLLLAGRGPTRLADLAGDQPAILGLPPEPTAGLAGWLAGGPGVPSEALDRLLLDVAPGLGLLPLGVAGDLEPLPEGGAALAMALREGPPTVLDAGLAAIRPAAQAAVEVADASVVVVRGCYLALRRAVRLPLVARAAGVVLVEEPGRALGEREVAEVLGLPVLGRFPVRASVARAVDAGVLAARLPSHLSGPAGEVLDALSPRLVAGRAA